MIEDLPIGWFIFGAIAIGGMVATYNRRAKARAVREQWVEAAQQLGFTLSSGTRSLFMSGQEGSLMASVAVKTDDNETKTRYTVEFPPLGFNLRVTPQAGWQGFLKTLGGQDIEIGDATFDDRFVVKASSPDLARLYFSSPRVAALNSLYGRYGGFVVSNDELVLMVNGLADEVTTIVTTMNNVMETAQMLQPEADFGEPQPDETTTAALERDEELQRIFDTIDEYAETEVAEDSAAPEPTTVPDVPVVASPDALVVADRLFGDHQLGYETERLFAAEFEGRSVEWSGVVKRPAGLMATRVFEDDDREVLVVEVASLDDELYGTTSIDAIVSFPAGAAPQRGDAVRFTGRLIGVDGVGKDLYVADGRLD